MICEKCGAVLHYGAKYCNVCGEAVPKGTYDYAYSRSVWGKLDKVKDALDIVLLKKLTGNAVFKTISLLAALAWLFFTMYGNLSGIRIKNNDAYSIAYSKTLDEYYLCPTGQEATLEMFAPVGTDKLVFTARQGENAVDIKEFTPEEYKKEGYTLVLGAYDYLEVEAKRKEKIADRVKIIVAEKVEVTK